MTCPADCRSFNATCNTRTGNCDCNPGRDGDGTHCNVVVCANNCFGHGTCQQLNITTVGCVCQPGYQGRDCRYGTFAGKKTLDYNLYFRDSVVEIPNKQGCFPAAPYRCGTAIGGSMCTISVGACIEKSGTLTSWTNQTFQDLAVVPISALQGVVLTTSSNPVTLSG